MDPIEQILDENNRDNIILYDEAGNPVEFLQSAVIPLEEKIYMILKPVEDERIAVDEALVFVINEYEGEEVIDLVEDDEIIDRVFNEYTELLHQAGLFTDEPAQ